MSFDDVLSTLLVHIGGGEGGLLHGQYTLQNGAIGRVFFLFFFLILNNKLKFVTTTLIHVCPTPVMGKRAGG